MSKSTSSVLNGAATIILFVFSLSLTGNLTSQVSQQWVQRYNGTGNGTDIAKALKIDNAGNVYVTGQSMGSNGVYGMATFKYNSAGVQQWAQTYNPGGYENTPFAIEVDALGNVYVTGQGTGAGAFLDYVTIKYNSAGVQQWMQSYDPGLGLFDEAYALAIDGAGNVYVTGVSTNASNNGDIVTIKYNSTGAQAWLKRYDGTGHDLDVGSCIAVDAAGNCYVSGKTTGIGANIDYISIKYDSSGVQQWLQTYNGPGNAIDYINALKVDVSGNVYVTGKSSGGSPTFDDFATIKYNSSGIQQWLHRYNGPNSQNDIAVSLAIDASGNVFVTGYTNSGSSGDDWGTIKLNSSGVLQWAKSYNVNYDIPSALCLDTYGDVYVTGASVAGYVTIKYNTNGTQLWLQSYNGPNAGSNQPSAIAVDAFGNVCVTGYSTGTGTGYDYATIKYSQAPPPVPALYTPANNAVNQPLSLNLVWNKSIYANTYRVQLALDSLFNTLVVNDSTLTDSIKSITGLSNITNYWWRVSSKNNYGTSAYSSVNKFTTIVPAPAAPNLITPVNNAVNQPVSLDLVWSKPLYSGTYRVQLSTDSLFNTLIVNDSTLTDSIKTVSGLANLTSYWWRVRAKNIGGTGSYSSVNKFTTIILNPTIPLQFSPQNNQLNVQLSTQLNWYKLPTAQTYHVQMAADSTMSALMINDSTLTDTVKIVTALTRSTSYFWRVRAKNTGGYSSFSPVWKFTTIPYVPNAPALISPSNGSTGQSLTPLLSWDSLSAGVSYNIQVATDTGFTNSVVDSAVTASFISVPAGRLSNSAVYYWRVSAINPGGQGPWSIVWSFTIAPIGISGFNSEIPKTFKLYNGYPNPFNPETKIKVDIPHDTYSRLNVYDILGREVTVLISSELKAGSYTITWNASNYPSGVYFYRLIAGDFVSTKKIVLIK